MIALMLASATGAFYSAQTLSPNGGDVTLLLVSLP
jgi:hypothetical protein